MVFFYLKCPPPVAAHPPTHTHALYGGMPYILYGAMSYGGVIMFYGAMSYGVLLCSMGLCSMGLKAMDFSEPKFITHLGKGLI